MPNIAMFGAGRIGKIHAENIHAYPECRVAAVIDPFEDAAKALAESVNAEVMSVDDAMTHSDIDAVFICSATDTHADLIELAAKNGKAIFCEKPIDLSIDRVRDCLQVVEQHNAMLMVGFNRRFDPNISGMRQHYEEGQIGKAESLTIISRDPAPPPVSYIKVSGGMFRDMTIHDFDIARFMIGEDVVAVTAHGSNMVDQEIGDAGDIDTGVIVLEFESGVMATIINSRRSGYGYDQRLEFHGSRGLIRVNNIKESELDVWGTESCNSAKPMHFFLERYKQAYAIELQHFIDVFAGRAALSCSGSDGLKALELAEAAIESLSTGTKILL
ncbi:inositol 2-dehydrogenase [Veronia nyctiphanis]|uniref:Inositol 2-dehydrogenase n=1 Tax=Veronia nyctiphanis TaxID=1278244 RepID=A0A4Q0YZN5_9GAMM|nr:inositol 2-dehydrogenase [Veronia nyctiphanis]RXJ74639.1 inositol 2-dehydrogenase [Veronia nyctiphanis]